MLFALKTWFGTRAPRSQKRPTTCLNVEALEGREVPAVIGFIKACPSGPVLHGKRPAFVRDIPGVQIPQVIRIKPSACVGPQPEPPTRVFPGDFARILLPSL